MLVFRPALLAVAAALVGVSAAPAAVAAHATTRDVYFTIAIAHVLAEAPFLLRML